MRRGGISLAVIATLFIATVAGADVPKVVSQVDQQIAAAWKANNITPALEVDDARFLRRVTIDLTGRLPEPDQVTEFLNDSRSDKRARLIERLLASPEYAVHWATYWDNILMGRLTREAYLDRPAFHEYLREGFAENKRWDKLARELLTAEGYNTNRQPLKGGSPGPKDLESRFSPASNWFLRHSRSIPDLSSATSKVFLGVQIQCAQCHDHKTEKWTQKDFKQFTACFSKTWASYVDRPGMLAQMVGTYRLEVKDRLFSPPADKYETFFGSYKDYINETPKLLNGPEVKGWGSRRTQLANWVTAADNPWFAQALVNRMWGKLLGTGFFEPIDDARPGNPALLPETLKLLADDFRGSGYDIRHLLTVILNTQAYQRACVELKLPPDKPTYWASYPIKALDVEELFDMIVQASGSKPAIDKLTKSNFMLVRNAFIGQFVTQMGTDENAEVTELEETIPRSLMLLNGALVNGSTRAGPGYGLSALKLDSGNDAQVIERLYLCTLSRRPSSDESKKWQVFLKQTRPVVRTKGPASTTPQGLAALKVSDEITKADKDADFAELLKHAKTGADFAALRDKMKNNADAGLFVKAFQAFAAEAPFQALAGAPGGDTPREQAWEDMYWALLNCTEFLSNH
ncbi:MAG: DUF1549 domain-containing protein [Planctomycetes bacterium]|nr:DUF1549 domain-containing protein [Planctomycetota bacterium]